MHGLSQGDFELARGLLGNGAPLSASSIAGCGRSGRRSWRLGESDVSTTANSWADGIYVKAQGGPARHGAMSDGRKEVLAVWPGHRESTESWLKVLRDLRDRGLRAPLLLMADLHLERHRTSVAGGVAPALLEPQDLNVLDDSSMKTLAKRGSWPRTLRKWTQAILSSEATSAGVVDLLRPPRLTARSCGPGRRADAVVRLGAISKKIRRNCSRVVQICTTPPRGSGTGGSSECRASRTPRPSARPRQVACFQHQRLPQVLVHHVGFGHPRASPSEIRT